jgi:hypothetical protein
LFPNRYGEQVKSGDHIVRAHSDANQAIRGTISFVPRNAISRLEADREKPARFRELSFTGSSHINEFHDYASGNANQAIRGTVKQAWYLS